ncbi:hypothetical protein EV401DRAFT_1882573 [Pisolithus croceorrhizus]|nr:hypothetical protein EV401DRAFT_1882573 [Pisolithus croceorrhizus]
MGIPGDFGEHISQPTVVPYADLFTIGSTLVGGLISAMPPSDTGQICSRDVRILDTLHASFSKKLVCITNYGVPASLEYIVWFASLLANLIVITVVQFFFAHKIFHLCRRKLRWLVTVPIVGTLTGAVLAHFDLSKMRKTGPVAHEQLFLALHRDTWTKRLLNTLIVYAVNRCWLTFRDLIQVFLGRLVVIGEVTTDADDQISWAIALDFIVGKLYANSLLASLNTRQHLRSQDSGSELDLNMNVIHFTNPSKLSGDMGSSKDGVRRFDGCEVVVIGAATELESAEIMTLQREAGVRY